MTQRQADVIVGMTFTFFGGSGLYFGFYGPGWAAEIVSWVGFPLLVAYFIGGAIYRAKTSEKQL